MNTITRVRAAISSEFEFPAVVFGIGIATLVLYLLVFAIHISGQNDFYREALPSYRLLDHGRFLAFIRTSPAYAGSLLMRAPFELLGSAFGASRSVLYVLTALPCLVAPGLLAGYMAAHWQSDPTAQPGGRRGVRPVDLVMLIPSVAIALNDGHPEDVLTSAFCVLAILLAQRGAGKAAGFLLGVAVINKSWAVVAIPLMFAVMPADRRLSSFTTLFVTAGVVLIPLTAIRATSTSSVGNTLGGESAGIFLIPQLLWWFGRTSWVAREAHILLVVVDWLVAGVWWWLRAQRISRPPAVREALTVLALIFFLRASLDPWDNFYYFAPFMMTLAAYEDPRGFPKLTWLFAIAIVIIVPPPGYLKALGNNGHAAVFTAFALLTIAWFGWRSFRPTPKSRRFADQAAT